MKHTTPTQSTRRSETASDRHYRSAMSGSSGTEDHSNLAISRAGSRNSSTSSRPMLALESDTGLAALGIDTFSAVVCTLTSS